MPMMGGIPGDLRDTLNKCLFLVGAFIIIYAILWILAELHLIPAIIFMIFPQLVLLADFPTIGFISYWDFYCLHGL